MSFFSAKKLLLFGLILLLLIGIPVGVYLAQQQQQGQSQAEQSSVLSFIPASDQTSPKTVTVGQNFTLDLMVNPGVNKVSVVAFELNYDPTKIAPAEVKPFVESAPFTVVIDPPVFEEGIIRGRVSTQNVTTAVSTTTKVGTFTFVALEEITEPTSILFGAPFTQILSAGSSDEAGEDVLSSTNPAFILATTEGTPEPTATTAPKGGVVVVPTTVPSSGTTTTVPGAAANKVPVCTSITANGALEGVAPFAASFSAAGSDPDGTVAKVTFNYGDGQVQDVIPSSTSSASGSASTVQGDHTYTTAGTYKTSAVVTDNKGGVSALGACELTMTITSPIVPTEIPGAPVATLEPTGPAETFIGIGIFAGILTFIGGLLFFTL